jgi:phosphoribosylformylglycinamidine synthase I
VTVTASRSPLFYNIAMPRALVIITAGINCDLELSRAFELAGATPQSVHLNELMRTPSRLDDFDLIGLPGGFSYGDAIAAGRIAAQLMRQTLYAAFVRAIERGTPIIAPCNGFQMAVQLGLLPGPDDGESWPSDPPRQTIALTNNESSRFVDRWCRVEIPSDTRCIWTCGLHADPSARLLPIAHGEGRLIPESNAIIEQLRRHGQIAIEYAADDNPNGSTADIAGLCDSTGLVFGLMPHPERYTRWTQHPFWNRLDDSLTQGEPMGLQMFRNAVAHVMKSKRDDDAPVITSRGFGAALSAR